MGLALRPDSIDSWGMGAALDLIGGIELAYAHHLSDSEWLPALAEKIACGFDAMSPATAYFFDFDESEGARALEFTSNHSREVFDRFHGSARVEDYRRAYLECDPLTVLSRAIGPELVRESFRRAGIPGQDSIGLRANATPSSGVIVSAVVGVDHRIRNRAPLLRIAAHVGAALRLRKRGVTPSPQVAAAVLSPTGELQHGDADAVAARAELGRAARAMDTARGALRRLDPEAAAEHWRAMVAGQWSLVDWIDHDGKRFLVAQTNTVAEASRPRLSAREHQAVAFAAMGHSNKLIAYDMGITVGSVSVLLGRAAKKLGTSSRTELVRAFRDWDLPAPDG